MTLREYLARERLTLAMFGSRCIPSINVTTLSRINRGVLAPNLDVAGAIVDATNREVTLDDLLETRREALAKASQKRFVI